MTAILRSENGNIKEVEGIRWLLSNAKQLEAAYIQDIGIYSENSCRLVVHVSKYRTFSTTALTLDTVKELLSDSKFDHVSKEY